MIGWYGELNLEIFSVSHLRQLVVLNRTEWNPQIWEFRFEEGRRIKDCDLEAEGGIAVFGEVISEPKFDKVSADI